VNYPEALAWLYGLQRFGIKLGLENIQLFTAPDSALYQAFDGDEFGIKKVGPIILAYGPEGRIAHVFHRREQQGEIRQLYVSDLYQVR